MIGATSSCRQVVKGKIRKSEQHSGSRSKCIDEVNYANKETAEAEAGIAESGEKTPVNGRPDQQRIQLLFHVLK